MLHILIHDHESLSLINIMMPPCGFIQIHIFEIFLRSHKPKIENCVVWNTKQAPNYHRIDKYTISRRVNESKWGKFAQLIFLCHFPLWKCQTISNGVPIVITRSLPKTHEEIITNEIHPWSSRITLHASLAPLFSFSQMFILALRLQ